MNQLINEPKKFTKRPDLQEQRLKRQALIREIGIVAVAKHSDICYQTASSFTLGRPIRTGIEMELIQGGLKATFAKIEDLQKQLQRCNEVLDELNEWKAECITT